MLDEKSISEFLDKEYKQYAYHVLEDRSINNLLDSCKSVQRKILYISEKYVRNTFNTVESLAGRLVSNAAYHHSSTSAEVAYVNMAQYFKNNFQLFHCEGQFGNAYSNSPASARYIKLKLHENYDLVFKDKELLEYKEEEGMKIEPVTFLPIICLVLLNGNTGGMGIAHSTLILNREVKPLIKDSISYLKGGKIGKLPPYINEFKGTFNVDENNHKKWYITGNFEHVNSTTLKITELPPSMGYEKIEEHLDNLMDKNIITNWENVGKGKIDYIIKFTREKLATLSEADINKLLKLTDQVTENFTVLDERGKIKIFQTSQDLLKYFCDLRLTYYDKRKAFQLKKIKEDIIKFNMRYKFVKLVIDGKIIINNKKKEDIIKQIDSNSIDKIDDSYDYLLNMPIYSLSKEKLDELSENIKKKKEEEKIIKASVPKEVYISELEELYKKLK